MSVSRWNATAPVDKPQCYTNMKCFFVWSDGRCFRPRSELLDEKYVPPFPPQILLCTKAAHGRTEPAVQPIRPAWCSGLLESHMWCRRWSSQFLGNVHLSLPQTSATLHPCGGWDLRSLKASVPQTYLILLDPEPHASSWCSDWSCFLVQLVVQRSPKSRKHPGYGQDAWGRRGGTVGRTVPGPHSAQLLGTYLQCRGGGWSFLHGCPGGCCSRAGRAWQLLSLVLQQFLPEAPQLRLQGSHSAEGHHREAAGHQGQQQGQGQQRAISGEPGRGAFLLGEDGDILLQFHFFSSLKTRREACLLPFCGVIHFTPWTLKVWVFRISDHGEWVISCYLCFVDDLHGLQRPAWRLPSGEFSWIFFSPHGCISAPTCNRSSWHSRFQPIAQSVFLISLSVFVRILMTSQNIQTQTSPLNLLIRWNFGFERICKRHECLRSSPLAGENWVCWGHVALQGGEKRRASSCWCKKNH